MFVGDILLDNEGNTVVRRGEMGITGSNIEFIIRSLRFGPDTWELYPDMGIGLDKYIGMPNTDEIHQRIEKDVDSYFLRHNILTKTTVVGHPPNTAIMNLLLVEEHVVLQVKFDLESGVFNFMTSEPKSDARVEPKEGSNKYLNRRGGN